MLDIIEPDHYVEKWARVIAQIDCKLTSEVNTRWVIWQKIAIIGLKV